MTDTTHAITGGGMTVEYTNRVKKSETPEDHPYRPERKQYERVEFLANGWLRCTQDDEDEDGTASVDYYPPQVVNGVYSVEEVNA